MEDAIAAAVGGSSDATPDSGNSVLNDKIAEWLRWDANNKTRNEIESLMKAGNWPELGKRLLARLSFGTAGLRGVMQAGFGSMNDLVVIQTAQGLAKYILNCFPDVRDREKGIVLGYDGRYHSRRFAELTACVFLNENVPVWLYSKTVATPFVPFAISQLACMAGVMVTASHNPKEDNGYKVYWQNGAQITSPHDKNIQNSILKSLTPLPSSWNVDTLTASPLLHDPYDRMFTAYYEQLVANIPQRFVNEYNAKSSVKFVYSAMHGVGYPFVAEAFRVAHLSPVLAVKEQRDPDPEFPTVKFPNPEEGKSSLVLSIALANENKCNLILANDPDADRLACAEKDPITHEWRVFTGNELGTLLGWWAVHCYKESQPAGQDMSDCYMLASTVSSKILHAMAKVDGFNFVETLTGFKWMGNEACRLMRDNKRVLFAFEEAIGFMFSPTVLDKDGISAACQLATMCCYLRGNGRSMSLSDKLNELYDLYGFHYTMTSYFLCYEPKTIDKMFEKIRNRDNSGKYPLSIMNGKYGIMSVRDLTTGKDTSQPDGIAILPVSKGSQMITFTFANGVVVTLRTSGTEPKIKYYAEMCAQPGESDWNKLKETLAEMVNAIIEELFEPALNNFTPRSD